MDKYSDKYINDYDILSNSIIGFEFEFYTEKTYYKLIELLNRELSPVKVSGYREHHSSFTPSETHWKIEPDLSGGYDMVELVTGPMPYVNAKIYMLKVLKILQDKNFTTNEKCSIHINISFDKQKTVNTLDNINKLKLILNIDENFIYKHFPNRENNIYAKSVKKIIPFDSFDYSSNSIGILTQSLELPYTKYHGINFNNVYEGDRLEFRYIGGEDYQNKTSNILELMDYFITLTWGCINVPLSGDDIKDLKSYLSKNINNFKKFNTVDKFIGEFPSIMLQVDFNASLFVLKSYYTRFYDKLYDIITNIYNLNNCIINYNTLNHKLELVDANFKTISEIENVDIVDSIVNGGSFSDCNIIGCEIKNAQFINCELFNVDVYDSKIENSKITDSSVLYNCYVSSCNLEETTMKSGIFRSGKLGDYCDLDSDVKIVSNINNFFNTKSTSDQNTTPKIPYKIDKKSKIFKK